MQVTRVLDPVPFARLDDYVDIGGFDGLRAAHRVEPGVVVETISDAGLRGRGGAGFPTGTKWQTVIDQRVGGNEPITVVVNGAEGEPGSFKDRAIIAANPYRVLEGALIAAHAVGADRVVITVKESFTSTIDALARAIAEIEAAGVAGAVRIGIAPGPEQYLFGEESAMLEVLDGRPPFPRVTPPYRHGVESSPAVSAGTDWVMENPVLVNNVETMANVAGIIANGAAWFREFGTIESPGTIVCTVTGRTSTHGVGEFALGTPLAEVIEALGGGPMEERRIIGAISGVANAVVPASKFTTPLTHEDMRAAGTGLGAAGFIILDDGTDLVATAASAARFLAVESCGQCEPCKSDGLAVAVALGSIRDTVSGTDSVERDVRSTVDDHLRTITDGARCSLAQQHQTVVTSLLDFAADHEPATDGVTVEFLPIASLDEGQALLDTDAARRNPDWSLDQPDSGAWPADRLASVADADDPEIASGARPALNRR
jgi:NADH-quinone oxidoreductase subunit F